MMGDAGAAVVGYEDDFLLRRGLGRYVAQCFEEGFADCEFVVGRG